MQKQNLKGKMSLKNVYPSILQITALLYKLHSELKISCLTQVSLRKKAPGLHIEPHFDSLRSAGTFLQWVLRVLYLLMKVPIKHLSVLSLTSSTVISLRSSIFFHNSKRSFALCWFGFFFKWTLQCISASLIKYTHKSYHAVVCLCKFLV